ncbi:MAG: 4-cresol dehydrogenase (hydroxylating) flavoprotein subunit [Blastocatellia bacterium]|jgi:4-cresol dehydrogenase (hydroxylating)|nr:4-cresol dehydrogenase (hydroxylating) flavoprotein subunit [Blastocatellia bacterium]
MFSTEALTAWRELLGEEYVTTDKSQLAAVETATFPTSEKVPAIIRPGTREQVQECLRIANRFHTPIYPISAGKNWGYGSRVPAHDGCVLLVLDRLKKIRDYDEQLAYITVEPGVTFAEANQFLRARGSDLMLNSPGSTADASIIGNVVERGIAGGLNGERAEQVCGLEVVLPNGDCIATGLDRFANATAGKVFPDGFGPGLDGLFIQSNLGIVTKLTHWLTPLPKFYQYFSFAIKSADKLAALVETLQAIKREHLIETSIGLYNAFKILSYSRRFPTSSPADRTLELRATSDEFRSPLEGFAWFGEAAVTAPDEKIGAALLELVKQRLAGAVDQLVVKEIMAENPLVGTSLETNLSSIYWRKENPPSGKPDPDKDRCGLIWLCPVAPFRGESVAQCVSMIERGMAALEFEPIISVQFHSPRAARVIASIVYDRDQPKADLRALACHDGLMTELALKGFYPYRLSTQGLKVRRPESEAHATFLRKIKDALDPNGILAPGRYV